MRQNFVDLSAEPSFATASAAAGSNAVITVSADADQFWAIDWISWSFDAEPTDGNLKVEIGGVTVWQVDITAAGPGHIEFCKPLYKGVAGQAAVVTLSGTDADKKLNVRYR